MLESHLDHVRNWYKERLDYDIPEVRLVEVPDDLIYDSIGNSLLFVPTGVPYDELNQQNLEQSISDALFLFGKNIPGFNQLKQVFFGPVLKQYVEEILRYGETEDDSPLDQFVHQHPENTVYVNERVTTIFRRRHKEEYTHVFRAFLAHEIFHLIQQQRGDQRDFPFSIEGVAMAIERTYATELLGSEAEAAWLIKKFNERAYSQKGFPRRPRREIANPEQIFSVSGKLWLDSSLAAVRDVLDLDPYDPAKLGLLLAYDQNTLRKIEAYAIYLTFQDSASSFEDPLAAILSPKQE